MKLIDEEYLRHPFYGSRRMATWLKHLLYEVNRKRIRRLMQKMCIEAFHPKKRTTATDKGHQKHPYLLRNLVIDRVNQVWGSDITYIPVGNGYLYLVAIMDWYSRYVLAWKLSNSLESDFCVESELPTIINTLIPTLGSTEHLKVTSTPLTLKVEYTNKENIISVKV